MTFWNPDSIRAAAGGTWLQRPPPLELPRDRPADLPAPALHASISGVSTDSRTLKPGEVFIALRGPNHDGHDHLAAAAAAGAPILIIDDPARLPAAGLAPAVGVMKVGDTGKALLRLAGAYRNGLRQTRVIAVCGSNGKTTTTRLIEHILSRTLRGTASIKSFNNAVGVPLTILGARENDQYLLCEVGTNAPGEIIQLADVLKPDIAVITSIGREHLEELGDLAGVAREEAAILSCLRPGGLAIVTADSPELAEHLKRVPNPVTFGRSPSATLRLTSFAQADRAIRFTVNDRLALELPLLGEHNALNAIAALAVARRMNIDEQQAARALATAPSPDMRLQRLEVGGISILNDAYNANPDSTIAALRTLAALRGQSGRPARRTIAILGEMLEMGAASAQAHRSVAHELVTLDAVDLVILVGSGSPAGDIGADGPLGTAAARDHLLAHGWALERVLEFPDCIPPRDREIAELLRDGDLVLVKGSRKVRLERIVEALKAIAPTPEIVSAFRRDSVDAT